MKVQSTVRALYQAGALTSEDEEGVVTQLGRLAGNVIWRCFELLNALSVIYSVYAWCLVLRAFDKGFVGRALS